VFAEITLTIGNHQAAVNLIERVEASEMKDQLAAAIAEVRSELSAANNAMQATSEDAC
jgi:hypothetical protein